MAQKNGQTSPVAHEPVSAPVLLPPPTAKTEPTPEPERKTRTVSAADPDQRAIRMILRALEQLKTPRAKSRCLDFVRDKIQEEVEGKAQGTLFPEV